MVMGSRPSAQEDRLAGARRLLAAAIAEEERLHQRYSEENALAERWHSRAVLAAGKQLGDMALLAGERQQQHERLRDAYRREYDRQSRYVAKLKRQVQAIETGRSSIRQAAQNRAIVRAILELEADPVADRFSALEREDKLEEQLAELKALLEGRQAESRPTEE